MIRNTYTLYILLAKYKPSYGLHIALLWLAHPKFIQSLYNLHSSLISGLIIDGLIFDPGSLKPDNLFGIQGKLPFS